MENNNDHDDIYVSIKNIDDAIKNKDYQKAFFLLIFTIEKLEDEDDRKSLILYCKKIMLHSKGNLP